jgi:hypothetical protein
MRGKVLLSVLVLILFSCIVYSCFSIGQLNDASPILSLDTIQEYLRYFTSKKTDATYNTIQDETAEAGQHYEAMKLTNSAADVLNVAPILFAIMAVQYLLLL